MSLKKVLTKIAQVTGKADNESIQELLKNDALDSIEINDELSSILTSGLMGMEEAKNNQELQDHFYNKIKGGIYKNVDDVTNSSISSLGLSEEEKETVMSGDSELKRLKTLISIAQNKAKEGGKSGSKEANEQIQALNQQISEIKEAHKKELKNKEIEAKNSQLNSTLKYKILGQNLINEIPGGKDFLAEATINNIKKQVHLDFAEDGSIEVKQKADPSLEVFEGGNKVTIEKILAKELEQFIKKTDSGEPKPASQKRFEPQKPTQMTAQQRAASYGSTSLNAK
jgi:hypothetical protein